MSDADFRIGFIVGYRSVLGNVVVPVIPTAPTVPAGISAFRVGLRIGEERARLA